MTVVQKYVTLSRSTESGDGPASLPQGCHEGDQLFPDLLHMFRKLIVYLVVVKTQPLLFK